MKKLLIALVAMGLAGFAQASYLYWQVSPEAVETFASESGASYGVQVKYGDNALTIADLNGNNTGKTKVNISSAQNPGYLIDISDITAGNSFYIEIVKWNAGSWNTVGVSTALDYNSYADINAYTVDLHAIAPTLPAAWTGGTYSAPEPTSGLLMLLGVAALGLKRRKA